MAHAGSLSLGNPEVAARGRRAQLGAVATAPLPPPMWGRAGRQGPSGPC